MNTTVFVSCALVGFIGCGGNSPKICAQPLAVSHHDTFGFSITTPTTWSMSGRFSNATQWSLTNGNFSDGPHWQRTSTANATTYVASIEPSLSGTQVDHLTLEGRAAVRYQYIAPAAVPLCRSPCGSGGPPPNLIYVQYAIIDGLDVIGFAGAVDEAAPPEQLCEFDAVAQSIHFDH